MAPPPANSPPQLKWHNTLPQHFSGNQGSKTITPGRRGEKRQIAAGADAGGRSKPLPLGEQSAPVPQDFNPFPSPTKRHRTGVSSNMTTPVKANQGASGTGGMDSAGSGMQTPPPSSSSSTRRRGRPPKALSGGNSKVPALSPISSPSKVSRHAKPLGQVTPSSANVVDKRPSAGSSNTPRPHASHAKTTPGSKDMGDIFESKSSYMRDPPLGWPSFEEGSIFPSTFESDLFMPSDAVFGDGMDPMALSFQCNSDFGSDCLPSINPTLIFSSRTTSDDSSLFGGYGDETDVLSNSSQANEQPYQHQYNYSKRERALEIERAQKRIAKLSRRRSGGDKHEMPAVPSEHILALGQSASMAASFDEAASRRTALVSRARDVGTPPPGRHLKPKTSVMLLISPSGRAKTETKVMYEDSETELDEVTNGSPSVDESVESDSSLDDPTPRGLGPGGKSYSAVRKSKASGFPALGPPLGLFSTVPVPGSSKPCDWDDTDDDMMAAPRTSACSAKRPVVRPSGTENVLHQTPRKSRRSFLDECILSSPKLPTPLKSSPGNNENRPKIMTAPAFGGLRMDSRLLGRGTILDFGEESEAETVVDENVPMPDPPQPEVNEGDALVALRNVVAKRRGSSMDMGVIKSPHKAKHRTSRSTASSRYGVKHSEVGQSARKPLFPAHPKKILRRRKAAADVGYGHKSQKRNSLITVSDPDNGSSGTDEDGSLDSGETIRCICGSDQDGGTLMVQCDSCNCWLHLKCTGLNRKQIPETYTCAHCGGDAPKLMRARTARALNYKKSTPPTSPWKKRMS